MKPRRRFVHLVRGAAATLRFMLALLLSPAILLWFGLGTPIRQWLALRRRHSGDG